jgi:hypothetical protein
VKNDWNHLKKRVSVSDQGRQLKGAKRGRTKRSFSDDLSCVVGQSGEDEGLKFFPFDFWFATEADTADMSFLPALETQLFNAVSSHIFWCYGRHATTDFGGRRLSTKEVSQREQEIRLLRRLGVVSVSSGAFDIATEGKPPLKCDASIHGHDGHFLRRCPHFKDDFKLIPKLSLFLASSPRCLCCSFLSSMRCCTQRNALSNQYTNIVPSSTVQ